MGIFTKSEKDIEIQKKDALVKQEIREKANQGIRQTDAYDLATFLSKDELKFDWSSRRKRVDASLLLFGGLLTVMTITLLISAEREKMIDQNYSSMFGGFYMFILFSFVTILGTYVFGSTFDSRSVRASATNMYASMMNARVASGAMQNDASQSNQDDGCEDDDPPPEQKHITKVIKTPNKKIIKRVVVTQKQDPKTDEAG